MRTLKVKKLDAESTLAVGIRGTDDKMVWLPKSQIEFYNENGFVMIDVPAWLADKHDTLEFED